MFEGKYIEFCCTSVEEVLTAMNNGADRIELCENLEVGGVTPSISLINRVLNISSVPVNILIRCRGGNFTYSDEEIEMMLQSIKDIRNTGANAVVIGALANDGSIDRDAVSRMIEAAEGMSVTFHKAFDVSADPLVALEEIISLGCNRLLTSGHEDSALEGKEMIAELVRRANSRIVILAGGKVRRANIDAICSASSAPEYHASIKNWIEAL